MEQFSTPQKTPVRSVLKEINSNDFASKPGAAAHATVKSPLGLDSDISGIDGDNTLSGLDTSIDSDYKNQNPNASFGDLLSGFGGLKLNTPQRPRKANNYDPNNTLSSDEELFQECENGYDLDVTARVSELKQAPGHSSNIDSTVFDKTINFSTIAANSTAAIGLQTSEADKYETLFQTGISEQTSHDENVLNTNANSWSHLNVTETNAPEVPSVQNLTNSQSEDSVVKEPIQDDAQKVEVLPAVGDDDLANLTYVPDELVSNGAFLNETVGIQLNVIESNTPEVPSVERFAEEQPEKDGAVNGNGNLNGTIVVDSTMQSINTSYVVSTEATEIASTQSETEPKENSSNLSALETDKPEAPLQTFETAIVEQTTPEENVFDTNGSSGTNLNVTASIVPEVPSVESFAKSQSEEAFTKPSANLNETVVVNNKLPSINTSYIVSPRGTDITPEQMAPEPMEVDASFTKSETDKVHATKANVNLDETMVVDYKLPSINTSYIVLPKANNTTPVQVTEEPKENPSKSPASETDKPEAPSQLNVTGSSIPEVPSDETFVKSFEVGVAKPNGNLNETIVVDNKLPSINTSYIISPAPKQNVSGPKENPFKLPAKPTTASNPFDLKHQAQTFEVPDDEFQSPGLILNSNDFDFLLSRGSNTGPSPRDSILERFDPILGRKSIVPTPLINKTETTLDTLPTSISTIREIDTICESTAPRPIESLVSTKSPVVQTNAVVNNSGDNKETAKLESSEKFDQSIGGDGDISQASSTTETYETASIGEPLKADVTMSVGLIHDLKMDNMKSLEQDKVEPNLKMNDEHKVKQEMLGDIERKLKEAEAREEALLRRITEKEKALNKMSAVVENYEKTMVEMISEREQLTQNYEKQLLQLKSERDANFHHLTSLENTFTDLHVKYEKSKQMTLEIKDSEAKLVEKLEFSQQQMKLQEQRYDKLKNHALSQLEGANAKLEALNKAHSNEMKKLTAQLKKEEISRQSIMEQLAQKTKENDELVKICDELINNGADGS